MRDLSNHSIEYKVIRRDIKYPRLEFRTGKLKLIVPNSFSNPSKLVEKNMNWISHRKGIIVHHLNKSKTKKIKATGMDKIKNLILQEVDKLSKDLGVHLNKIYFRKMKTKWASCSKQGNITVNSFVKYLPKGLIKYIVFHEMIHLKIKRHNELFWKLISKRYKNYRKMEEELFTYWFAIQQVEG